MSVVDMSMTMLRTLRLMGHWKALEGWRSFLWGSGYECFVNEYPMCTKLATVVSSLLFTVGMVVYKDLLLKSACSSPVLYL